VTFRLSETAEAELEEIYEYIAADKPSAAGDVIDSILDAIEQLTRYANSGRPGRRKGTRELIRPPFVIVYRIDDQVIDVLSICQGSRKYN